MGVGCVQWLYCTDSMLVTRKLQQPTPDTLYWADLRNACPFDQLAWTGSSNSLRENVTSSDSTGTCSARCAGEGQAVSTNSN